MVWMIIGFIMVGVVIIFMSTAKIAWHILESESTPDNIKAASETSAHNENALSGLFHRLEKLEQHIGLTPASAPMHAPVGRSKIIEEINSIKPKALSLTNSSVDIFSELADLERETVYQLRK